MHGRIYQLAESPVPVNDYIDLGYFFEHRFCVEIADSVDDGLDRDSEIKMFCETYANRGVITANGDQSFELTQNGKSAYFGNAFPAFNAAISELGQITEGDFQNYHGKVSGLVYKLRNSFNEQFGDYIAIFADDDPDDFRLITMDEFMREAVVGKTYYIGAIIDYHW